MERPSIVGGRFFVEVCWRLNVSRRRYGRCEGKWHQPWSGRTLGVEDKALSVEMLWGETEG